ncbi:hypothetical protein K469DRAFT_778477 [Zopfia rhizophila CBS 207.26]|uniref:Uncharacterized protein n=1 Tax=Zopfia rhizophila CBS 207.26 TaxID=1314779 RepID=A0A6A6E162_9PEZI|nr:hypothetical protein K469DRAFT_778477 [Zopfia rhizophila CBS 207.26]
MPIVGSTDSVTNVSDWSHSTVFTTLLSGTLSTINVPPLTTVYTPPASCVDRWMLGNGHTITEIAITPVTLDDGRITMVVTTLDSTSFAQNFTVFSTKPSTSSPSDPLYTSCQRYSVASYSPGVCPDGQTIAEVTEYQVQGPTGSVDRFWQASCCRRFDDLFIHRNMSQFNGLTPFESGMTFGSEWPRACLSSFSTPFRAYALLTTIPYSGASSSTVVYEYVTSTFVGGSFTNGYSSSTASNITTVTLGMAVADPVVVAWELQDFSLFPTGYASSLAQKIGVSLESTPTPATTSSLPQQTNPPSEPHNLSTGQKAGAREECCASGGTQYT